MIYCTQYTPSRINVSVSEVSTPLTPFKEMDVSVPCPVVYDGSFYCSSSDYRLACYNEKSGELIWVSQTEELLTTSPFKVGDQLFVVSFDDENVITIDANNGKQLNDFGNVSGFDWLLQGTNIYLKTFLKEDDFKRQFVCRNSENYKVKWIYKGLQFDFFASSDDYILLKDGKGNLTGLNTIGEELWNLSPLDTGLFGSQSEIDALPDSKPGFHHVNRTIGFPMIYQNRIGVVPMLDNHFVGVDLATGKVLWVRMVQNSHNWIRQGYCDEVYCLSSGYIEAFSLENGEQTRKVAIDGSYITESLGIETISFTQFAVSETHIFAASSIMQYFSAINIETGKVDWTFNPDEAITATDQPYVTNGRVYYPCLGRMYIFEGQGGYTLAA